MGSIAGLIFMLSSILFYFIHTYRDDLGFNINSICKVALISVAVLVAWTVLTFKTPL